MNTITAAAATATVRQVATDARARFQPTRYAGQAELSATSAFHVCTLVRFGKADRFVAADLFRRMAHEGAEWMPHELWNGLLRTADELSGAARLG